MSNLLGIVRAQKEQDKKKFTKFYMISPVKRELIREFIITTLMKWDGTDVTAYQWSITYHLWSSETKLIQGQHSKVPDKTPFLDKCFGCLPNHPFDASNPLNIL